MLVECNVLLASVRPPARRLRRVRHRRSLLQLSAAAGQASDERRAHRHNSLPAEQTLVRGRVQDPGNVEVAPLAKLAPSSCEPALRFDRWPSGYAAHVVSKHTNRGYAGIALGAVLVIVAFVAALTGPRRRALPEILTASGRSRSPLLSPRRHYGRLWAAPPFYPPPATCPHERTWRLSRSPGSEERDRQASPSITAEATRPAVTGRSNRGSCVALLRPGTLSSRRHVWGRKLWGRAG